MNQPDAFDTMMALLREVAERQQAMEQRQVRMETRLCTFIQAEGQGDLIHTAKHPARLAKTRRPACV